MSIHRDHHLDLCAGLAIGALDDPDRRELEQHLAEGCPECEAELSRLMDTATLLAAAAPPLAPPPALKARVLASVRALPPIRGRSEPDPRRPIPLPRRRRSIASWSWAAAAAAFAAISVFLWVSSGRLRGELAATQSRLDATRRQLADRQQQLADEQRWSALLESAGARVVDLELTKQGSAVMRARAIYDPQARRAIIVFDHASPPSGSDYQLWALRDGRPESLGLIRPDASGRAVVKLPDTGDPTSLGAFAVSLEKAGGSTSAVPEGPVVMLGKIGS